MRIYDKFNKNKSVDLDWLLRRIDDIERKLGELQMNDTRQQKDIVVLKKKPDGGTYISKAPADYDINNQF